MRKRGIATSLWVLVVIGAVPVNGTMFVRRTFDEFVAEVDRIVVGEVVRVETDWEPTAHGSEAIFTQAVFRVERQVKGEGFAEELILRAPGGYLDGIEQWMPAAPQFGARGDRFIVFLWDEADEFLSNIAYWERGIFRVDEDGRVEGTRYSEDQFVLDVARRLQAQEGGRS